METAAGFHMFHFFGALFILFIGIMIGKAIMFRRMMCWGAGPWAGPHMWRGGGCGWHRYGPPPAAPQAEKPAPAPETTDAGTKGPA